MKKVRRIVALNGLVLEAYHGVYDFEREKGGRFQVDIRVSENAFLKQDEVELNETIDYERLLDIARDAMKIPAPLLETVANRIMCEILLAFPKVKKVKIRLAKLNPPLHAEIDSSSVCLVYKG